MHTPNKKFGDVIPFMPKPEDLRFFNDIEAESYAKNAGFKVDKDKRGMYAFRDDMAGIKFVLKTDRDAPDRVVWVRINSN